MGPMQFISKFPFIKEQSIKEQEHNSEERLYYMYLHIRALHADWLATFYYYYYRTRKERPIRIWISLFS